MPSTSASTSASAGPVAIGGVGGSGTRVIAAIVESLGFDPGGNLNEALDECTFITLFKRPNVYWGERGLIRADHPAAVAATRLYVSVRTGGRRPMADVVPMIRASLTLPSNVPSSGRSLGLGSMGRRFRRLRRLPTVFRRRPPDAGPWMWKDPNTQIFLPTFFEQIPDFRYIHMVRDGLAMATSSNRLQLNNWGFLFDIGRDGRDREARQLLYWARANLAVADLLADQPRSLIVSHERTIADPVAVAEEISSFLGTPLTDVTRRVIDEVRVPSDADRTFTIPDGVLSPVELADVRRALDRFGYGGAPD